MKLVEEEWADDDDAIATVAELQRRYSRKLQAATRQPKAARAASTVSAFGSSSSGAPPGKRPFALVAHRGLTQKEAKAYIPPGTTITKIATRDSGWQIKTPDGTRYKQLDATRVETDNAALTAVVLFAWKQHTDATGTECDIHSA